MLTRALPDVTSDVNAETPSRLQWVGMEDIAVPIKMSLQSGKLQTIAAKANVYVSLEKPEVKGIHMSRLHTVINQLAKLECKKQAIEQLLNAFRKARDLTGLWKSVPKGMKPPTFHEIRSLADALAAQAGYQTKQIQLAMAHSDESVTLMYQADHDLPHDNVEVAFTEEMIGRNFWK